ncbi:MAG: Cys-tRNA(Pro) deacylase [Lachnospiraceae bacterium]|nr:Cys-tRNA(Pro) deacylase [Lachnospiraceae bacterium]
MATKEVKTNAMRILDTMKISYRHMEYECKEFTDGGQIADTLGLPHERVFKTLVTVGADKNYYVFVLPIDKELDFKKCARAVGVKNIEMIPVKDINKVTGYIRGGTTSIGMKKKYVTRVSEDAKKFETIFVSGGRIGSQLEIAPDDLLKADSGEWADFTKD